MVDHAVHQNRPGVGSLSILGPWLIHMRIKMANLGLCFGTMIFTQTTSKYNSNATSLFAGRLSWFMTRLDWKRSSGFCVNRVSLDHRSEQRFTELQPAGNIQPRWSGNIEAFQTMGKI